MAEQNTQNRRQPRKQQPVDNTYAHLQPQALDVERAVLGALIPDHLKESRDIFCLGFSDMHSFIPHIGTGQAQDGRTGYDRAS